VAAQEQQRERVVPAGGALVVLCHGGMAGRAARLGQRDGRFAAPTRLVAAQLVGEPPRRHRDEPALRVIRHALGGPLRGRGEQCLLDGVLGRVEMPVAADGGAEHLRREVAQQALDARIGRHISTPSGLRTIVTSPLHRD